MVIATLPYCDPMGRTFRTSECQSLSCVHWNLAASELALYKVKTKTPSKYVLFWFKQWLTFPSFFPFFLCPLFLSSFLLSSFRNCGNPELFCCLANKAQLFMTFCSVPSPLFACSQNVRKSNLQNLPLVTFFFSASESCCKTVKVATFFAQVCLSFSLSLCCPFN